jgi:hypothetical protein
MAAGKHVLQLADRFTPGQEADYLIRLAAALANFKREQSFSVGQATLIAAEDIPALCAVNVYQNTVRKASAAVGIPACGISWRAAVAGQPCTFTLGHGIVQTPGAVASLTADSSVYLGNAGALVYVKPGSGMIQGLGYTLSATELLVTISQP